METKAEGGGCKSRRRGAGGETERREEDVMARGGEMIGKGGRQYEEGGAMEARWRQSEGRGWERGEGR